MLLANETVAQHLERPRRAGALPHPRGAGPAEGRGVRGVHRDASATASARRPTRVRPRHFQRLVERIAGKPEEKPIAFLMLRTMQKARYDPANLGHFGLAAPSYTHFTSPIRRYPDLVVHRTLRESRRRQVDDERGARSWTEDLPEIARHTLRAWSGAPTRPSASWCSGRRCGSWPTRSATSSTATSPASRAFGLFIELVEHFVEGLVHVSTMADDYYRFVETAHVLRGENTRQGVPARRQGARAGDARGHGAAADRSRAGRDARAVRAIERNRGPRRSRGGARARTQGARPEASATAARGSAGSGRARRAAGDS